MRKLMALVGLAVLGIGGYFVVDHAARAIPAKLERLTTEALRKANIVGVTVTMDGLDAELTGAVATSDQREVAALVVGRVSGVRQVDSSRLSISAPDRGPGEPATAVGVDLDATWSDGRLAVKGHVLGRGLDERIAQKVAQLFAGAPVTRAVTVHEGASDHQDALFARVAAGLEALAMTAQGTLRVTEAGVTLQGSVVDEATRERMATLLRSQVSPGGELALSVVVTPPAVPPADADVVDADAAVADADAATSDAVADAAVDAVAADVAPVMADAAAPAAVPGGAPHGVDLAASSPLTPEVCEEVLWWLVEGDKRIQFDKKKQIAPESEATVALVAKVLVRCGDGPVLIEGYTDAYGEPDDLRGMALRWAQNVKKRLVELGLAEERLQVKSYGYNRARYPDKPDTRLLNRRIEFKLKGVK